jgi:hypothetical protein
MRPEPERTEALTPDLLATALVTAAATARWPAGPLLLDLDEHVLRHLLAPCLAAALQDLNNRAAGASR